MDILNVFNFILIEYVLHTWETSINCVQLGLVPILAIGIPHCKTCTVVSTAAWMSSKEQTADTD